MGVSLNWICFSPGRGLWQALQATARWTPSKGNLVFEWSNPATSTHDLVLWQAAQHNGVPSGLRRAMRSLNSPGCTALRPAVQDMSLQHDGMDFCVLPFERIL